MSRTRTRRAERGQSLVLMVLALVALLGMTAVVIDGGNAWGQQRITQNGADAAAEAGAVVLVERLAGVTRTDSDVAAAVAASATANGISVPDAYYTDIVGNMLDQGGAATNDFAAAARVGDGTIPPDAAGVRAFGEKSFPTYIAGILGANTWTARTEATAVAGVLSGVCPASAGCGVVPVTFPVAVSTCDGTNSLVPGVAPWPLVSYDGVNEPDEATMATVPLCQNEEGSVGWLDLGDGNLAQQISSPSNTSFGIPTWLQSQTGNVNAVEDDMNAYAGQVILLPLFDGTCKVQPSGLDLGSCPNGQDGVGNNTWYHIPKFTGFLLDRAYIQGNNSESCDGAGGNGATSCLNGWFVRYLYVGPVAVGNPGSTDPTALGVQLIK